MTAQPTAWMIRNDGAVIPIVAHIYADRNEPDELLALAHFLWEHDPNSRGIVREFLDRWSFETLGKSLPSRTFVRDEAICAAQAYLAAKPYRICPETFSEIIADSALLLRRRGRGEYIGRQRIDGRDMIDTLNQRFLRVRYGGRYNTVLGCGDMYFRVSSLGFDWFPITRAFVTQRAESIVTVTIVRDLESTGCEKYYADLAGHAYRKMPITDFLAGSGRTTVLTCRTTPQETPGWDLSSRIAETLLSGGSVRELRRIRANCGRVRDALEKCRCVEEDNLIEGEDDRDETRRSPD